MLTSRCANDANPPRGEAFTRCLGIKGCRVVLALALTLLTVPLSPAAQQPVDQAARSLQPSVPVTLTLRFADGRNQFRPGEILPIELEFDSPVSKRFVVDGATYDRSGRLTIDELVVEPDEAVTDPLLDYFAQGGSSLGGVRQNGVLGEKPFTVKLDLNEWLRFDKAGVYTLSVRSRRVSDDATAATTWQSNVAVESNTVSFEILPRDVDWEARQLSAALQILNAMGWDLERRKGCRMLRFLATDRAVDELIKHYDEARWGCDFEYAAGLFNAVDREHVVRQLEAGLRANDQPVSDSYLRTLALLSVFIRYPELRPAQTRATKGRLIRSSDPGRLQDLVQAAKAAYEEILDAALPEKTARARAVILSWRVETGRHADPSFPTAARDRLREQLAASFLELPAEQQTRLLEYQWPSVAGQAMVPVLRALVEAAPRSSSLPDLALRRLYELAPAEGRARILREIRNPSPTASLKTLGMLPDRELPELDDILAANVEMSEDFDALAIRAELLHRYASRAVSARVLSRVDDLLTRMACRPQAGLLAFFVRANPDLGQALLDRVLAWRDTAGCYQRALRDVATLRMTPGVEATAVAHLDDPDPQVVISAAETLGRYGSRASAQSLRAQFERWHGAWEGRQEELRFSRAEDRPNTMQGMVEFAFLNALGRGQAWLADNGDVRALRMLCVTDNCRTQADHMIAAADDVRISILRVDNPDNSLVTLAQYQLNSIASLEQKLAQYPKGTTFTLDVSTLDPQIAGVVVSEVTKFTDAQGMTMRR